MSENFTYLVNQVAHELREQELVRHEAGYDPMRMTYGGTVTRPSNSFTAPAAGFGFSDDTGHMLLDGPIPINPERTDPIALCG